MWLRYALTLTSCCWGYLLIIFVVKSSSERIASLFAAVTAMLSGPVIVWLQYPIVNSLASFPLMLLAGEKIICNRRPIPWIGALGVGIGLSILGGHPETTFNICFAFALYFSFRLILKKTGIKRALLSLGAVLAGVVLGLLLGAIQWVPFSEFLLNSATLSEGGRSMGGAHLLFSGDWLYNLSSSVTFLLPDFFGSPLTHNYLWPFPTYQNYNEQTVYFGLIPLALALPVLFHPRRRSQALILIGISLFFLGVAWRLPGFELVNHIPPFSLLLNSRLKMFVPLMMAVVAGIGLDEWLKPEQKDGPSTSYEILVLVPSFLTLAIFVMIGSVNLFLPALSLHNSTCQAFIQHLVYQVFNINQPRMMTSLAIAVIFIILCVLSWRRIINRTTFGFSVLTFSLVELVVLGWHYNPVTDRNQAYAEIPLLSVVGQESQPFRTMSTDLSLFPPNAGAAYRIAQVEGYDYPVFQSEYDLYRAQGGDKASHRQVWSINYPLVDWLNIRYVISAVPIQKNGYRLVLDQPAYKVYRNENAYPRAYMVYDYQVIEDREILLETMVASPEMLKEKALFDHTPPNVPAVNELLPAEIPAQVEFTYYGMDRAVLNVSSERAGFLVMSDIYAPGWKAMIDGQSADVLNANYAYRAIYLVEGQHQVEFYYAPDSFTIGKTLSLSGLIILFVLGIYSIYAAKRNSLLPDCLIT